MHVLTCQIITPLSIIYIINISHMWFSLLFLNMLLKINGIIINKGQEVYKCTELDSLEIKGDF